METISDVSVSGSLAKFIDFIQAETPQDIFISGRKMFENGDVQVLSQGKTTYEFLVTDLNDEYQTVVTISDSEANNNPIHFSPSCSCKYKGFCNHRVAVLFDLEHILKQDLSHLPDGKQYTRAGMIKRVLEERQTKAHSEVYNLAFSKNNYGEHLLTTEKDVTYKLTFRDLKTGTGYCSCPDYKKNKLGTCKHLMYAFFEFKKRSITTTNKSEYPFIEVFLDPFNDYKISYFYPSELSGQEAALIEGFFNKKNHFIGEKPSSFLHFIKQAEQFENVVIRPEVFDLVEEAFDAEILQKVKQTSTIDLSFINADLFPYQKQGVEFATYLKGAIIADEMGLGKTLQAIAIALVKKQLFGFKRTLIICPASLKDQWKKEIEKFSNEKATVVNGFPDERAKTYAKDTNYFLIINYETVLRDKTIINQQNFDFIVLDEAQKIKNYETITANAIKSLNKKHGLVITGTPIENKLLDLYSIMEFLNPKLLSPMWEFSYQHCLFDEQSKNKITGYTNLQALKEKITPILLRRTKKDVLDQLYSISEITIPVEMHDRQRQLHASYAQGIASILFKKFKTSYDWQKLTMLLQSMRMVCDSSFLVDPEANFSPKLNELKDVLLEKLDLINNNRKVIIFSEWTKMNWLIGNLLKELNINFTELNGKVPVKKRQALIEEFENNDNCRVFLSTEAGGSGLNLQVADTVINFELPWNPAKKNQRIGRIDRLGQKNKNLTVINFITVNSIEMKIASGLMAKQELFDNVLNSDAVMDSVDFSDKGRAQFLKELELSIQEFTQDAPINEAVDEEIVELISDEEQLSITETQKTESSIRIKKLEEMETVMNKGMEFLTGMFKMATGQELSTDGNKIEVNKETGEVVMRFKINI